MDGALPHKVIFELFDQQRRRRFKESLPVRIKWQLQLVLPCYHPEFISLDIFLLFQGVLRRLRHFHSPVAALPARRLTPVDSCLR